MRNRTYVLVVVVVTAQLAACSRRETPSPVTTPKSPPTTEHATDQSPLIVSVAASATEVMESLCDQFAKKNGIETKINPGPSSGLAAQILNGAPANVFLSANEQWADEINRAGRVEAMHPLLTNRLVMVVPMSNPGGVTHPEDLLSEKVSKIALAGEKVPAGIYAEQALENLDLLDQLDRARKIVRGQDVRSALSYVERGEAEAGIVYSTDVGAAPGVMAVHEFDPAIHDRIVYVLVLLKQESSNDAARKLYQFLRSAEAMKTYEKFGFSSLDKPSSASAPATK